MRKVASAPIAALLAMIVIWGYSWVVMAMALRHAHPFDFAALRVAIGSVLLFLIVAAQGRSLRLPRYGMAMLLGFLQVGVFVALSQFALLHAGPGKTSVLVFTMPFWMILFARFILRERMAGAQWLAVGLAFAGLALIVAPWRLSSFGGGLLAVAAGAVWAITAVLSKKWPVAATDPLLFTAWQLLFGFVLLGVLALLHEGEPVRWNFEFAWTLLFSSVLATGIGWWLWTYVLAHTPAGIAGLNSLGIPVIAVVSGAIQLGERPSPLELAGMLAIGVALGLLGWLGLRRAAALPSAAAGP